MSGRVTGNRSSCHTDLFFSLPVQSEFYFFPIKLVAEERKCLWLLKIHFAMLGLFPPKLIFWTFGRKEPRGECGLGAILHVELLSVCLLINVHANLAEFIWSADQCYFLLLLVFNSNTKMSRVSGRFVRLTHSLNVTTEQFTVYVNTKHKTFFFSFYF